jgi:hypothetical protein
MRDRRIGHPILLVAPSEFKVRSPITRLQVQRPSQLGDRLVVAVRLEIRPAKADTRRGREGIEQYGPAIEGNAVVKAAREREVIRIQE